MKGIIIRIHAPVKKHIRVSHSFIISDNRILLCVMVSVPECGHRISFSKDYQFGLFIIFFFRIDRFDLTDWSLYHDVQEREVNNCDYYQEYIYPPILYIIVKKR